MNYKNIIITIINIVKMCLYYNNIYIYLFYINIINIIFFRF